MNIQSVIQSTKIFFSQPERKSQFDLSGLRERNEVRRKEAIEKLGEKWLLHPNNFKNKDSK